MAGWRGTTGKGRGSARVARQEGQFTIISGKRRKYVLLNPRSSAASGLLSAM